MKTVYLLMAALLFMMTSADAHLFPMVQIVGSGSSIDGSYIQDYEYGGKWAYVCSPADRTVLWRSDVGEWRITDGSGSNRYYYNTADTPVPPNVGWLIGENGTAPAPVAAGDAASLLVGDGTSESPYQISSLNGLYWIAKSDSAWGKYFLQTAHINASQTVTWFSGAGWISIGNTTTKFSGSYDGQDHTITGLTIDRTDDTHGLFGYANDGAVVKNVRIVNVSISNTTGESGGLIGTNRGTVTNCSSTGGSVYAWYDAGGLIGLNFVGSISQCFSTTAVSGMAGTGGFVGRTLYGTITDCYSTGAVTGSDKVGGFIGQNQFTCTISNCFSTGNVTGTSLVGGLIGTNSITVNNSFWDVQSSGIGSSAAGTGKTTAEMKSGSIFIDAGWNNTIWYMDGSINDGYPYLAWQNPGGTPMPVELVTFSAKTHGTSVELLWKTAAEVNNHGFEVERRSMENGQLIVENWISVGFVEGSGTINVPKEYSFSDKNLQVGKYAYRLKQIDRDGKFTYTNIVGAAIADVKQFVLEQNYPNPFNPATMITFQIPTGGLVSLKVFDAVGREVSILVNEVKETGTYSVRFDGSALSSGVYFYMLRAGTFSAVKKLIVMK